TGSNNQSPPPRRGSADSLELKLADTGIFWVGTSNKKKMPYGTIHVGQMFVQYFEPAVRRYPLPVILVHGGGGQRVHYMGLCGLSGWAGPATASRPATRCSASIVRATAARPITPMRLGRLARSSHTIS